MTVNELMDYLEELDGDAEVRIMMWEVAVRCAIRGVVTRDQLGTTSATATTASANRTTKNAWPTAKGRASTRMDCRQRRVHRGRPAGAIRQQAGVELV